MVRPLWTCDANSGREHSPEEACHWRYSYAGVTLKSCELRDI